MQSGKIYKRVIISLLFYAGVLPAQKDAQYIYDGNNMYHSGKIPESSAKYARALELNPNNKKANFNLGNSLYKNALMVKKGALGVPANTNIKPDSLANMIFDKAAQNFAVVANSVSDKDTLHQAWHNIGNCYLQKKEYQQAVDAYKKSLKFNPKDEETRYNLAYALKNLPKDKKGGGGGGQSNQPQKKDENKDKKDQQPQQQQSQMSKDQAEQLLKALMDSEKKLQDKRKQKQEDAANSSVEKDW
jgi:Ca-activated chloride channel family protein